MCQKPSGEVSFTLESQKNIISISGYFVDVTGTQSKSSPSTTSLWCLFSALFPPPHPPPPPYSYSVAAPEPLPHHYGYVGPLGRSGDNSRWSRLPRNVDNHIRHLRARRHRSIGTTDLPLFWCSPYQPILVKAYVSLRKLSKIYIAIEMT